MGISFQMEEHFEVNLRGGLQDVGTAQNPEGMVPPPNVPNQVSAFLRADPKLSPKGCRESCPDVPVCLRRRDERRNGLRRAYAQAPAEPRHHASL